MHDFRLHIISRTFTSLLVLLLMSLALCNCNNAEQTEARHSAIELPPPPTIQPSSRPSRPAPEPNQANVQQIPITGTFAPHPLLEEFLNTTSSLFAFEFELPGEMAPPRHISFSGILNTTLTAADFPAFQLQLWSNNPQDTIAVFAEQLAFKRETQDAYSFQITTPDAVASGLYYYLISDEAGRLFYANKVIVDY